MSASTDTYERMSGAVLVMILKEAGLSQAEFCRWIDRRCAERDLHMATSRQTLWRMNNSQPVPDLYAALLEECLGEQVFRRWRDHFQEEYPDEFSPL